MDSVAELTVSNTVAESAHWQARQVVSPAASAAAGALASGFGRGGGADETGEVELQIVVPAGASGGDMLDITVTDASLTVAIPDGAAPGETVTIKVSVAQNCTTPIARQVLFRPVAALAGVMEGETQVSDHPAYASNLDRHASNLERSMLATRRKMRCVLLVDALVTGLHSLTGDAYENIVLLIGLAFYVGILVGCWGTWSRSYRAMTIYLCSCFAHSAYTLVVLIMLPDRFRCIIYMTLTWYVTQSAWRFWLCLSSLARLPGIRARELSRTRCEWYGILPA